MRLLYLIGGEADGHLLKALRELGHTVEVARAEDILSVGETDDPDGVIVDLRAPSPDWAAKLASMWPSAFQVQVTGETAPDLAAATLRAGADACFVRPLEVREIAGRLEAAARRRAIGGGVTLQDRRLVIDGEAIDLAPRERLIVEILAQRPGRVLTAEEIGERIWGAEAVGDPASIRAAISRLGARVLREHGWRLIVGERGRGYRFQPRRGD